MPSPYLLSSSDNAGIPLVSYTLTRTNYSIWAWAMKNSSQAKNMLGFIDGTLRWSDPSAPEASSWRICNFTAIVAYVDDAKVLWNNLRERFSQGNAPRIYQLKNQMSLLRQDGLSIASFSAKMGALWDKLENYARARDRTCGATCNRLRKKKLTSYISF